MWLMHAGAVNSHIHRRSHLMYACSMSRLISILVMAATLLAQPTQPAHHPQATRCAISLLNILDEPSEKAETLTEIAKLQIKAGEKAQADALLTQALAWVTQTKRGLFRAGSLGNVVEVGSREHVEHAIEIAKGINGSDGVWAIRQLLGPLAKFGLSDQANELLSEGISRTNKRNTTEVWYGDQDYELALLLGAAASAGLVERALTVGRGIKNPFTRANILHPASIRLAEDKQCRRAVTVARSIHYEIERIDALVEVANACTSIGDKSASASALSKTLVETRKNIFDPREDTKAKALVSISLAYEKLGERERGLMILRRAEKVAYTIERSGFRDSGLSQVALSFAQYGLFDDALRVTSQIPSPWSDVKSNTLASIASYLLSSGNRERASEALTQAEQVTKDIDCTYFKYGMSARSCFGNKVSDFLKIAFVYQEARMFDKETEMLDLAVLNNQYRMKPPHQIIEEGSSVIGNDQIGVLEIVNGYLAANQMSKAIQVASTILRSRDKAIAVAAIEFKLGAGESDSWKLLRSTFGC